MEHLHGSYWIEFYGYVIAVVIDDSIKDGSYIVDSSNNTLGTGVIFDLIEDAHVYCTKNKLEDYYLKKRLRD